MTDKYQKALDKIKSNTNTIIDKCEGWELIKNSVPQECFDTLQDLIYEYNLTDAAYNCRLHDFEIYKKALNRACEKLADYDWCLCLHDYERKSKEQWKEWALKE